MIGALLIISILLVYGIAYYRDSKRDKSVLKDITLIPKYLILFFILGLASNLIRNIIFKPSNYFQRFNNERIKIGLDTLPENWETTDTIFKSWFDYISKNRTDANVTFLSNEKNKSYYQKRLDYEGGKLILESDYYKQDSSYISKTYNFRERKFSLYYIKDNQEMKLSLSEINDSIRIWKTKN